MNNEHIYKKRFVIFVFSVSLFYLVAFLFSFGQKNDFFFHKKKVFENLKQTQIEASSVYIFDATENNVVFERNATELLPLASITKIMTALVASELFAPEESISVTLPYLDETGTTIMQKDDWHLKDLIQLMMTRSSNEAAESLSYQKSGFIDAMNKKAKELGMWKAQFYNASGLDVHSAKAGGYATAEEVTFMTLNALNKFPYIFETTTKRVYNVTSKGGRVYMIENTNPFAPNLPGLIASKTGFTDLAGGNLVFAFNTKDERGKMHLLIVTLLRSSKEGRFKDASNIIDSLLKDFNQKS